MRYLRVDFIKLSGGTKLAYRMQGGSLTHEALAVASMFLIKIRATLACRSYGRLTCEKVPRPGSWN
jgi:hypothetical protein